MRLIRLERERDVKTFIKRLERQLRDLQRRRMERLQSAEDNTVAELHNLDGPESPDEPRLRQEPDQDDSEDEPYVIKTDDQLYFIRASSTSDEYDPESPEM